MPTGRSDLVDIGYDYVITDTEKAWLFDFNGEKIWIPKSMCEVDEGTKTVTMKSSLAIEKEIDGYAK